MQPAFNQLFFSLILILISIPSFAQNDFISNDSDYSTSTRLLKSNHIPDSIFQKKNLRYLSIQGEDCDYRVLDSNENDVTQCWMIDEIPQQIETLQNLLSLRLTLSVIRVIPKELTKLKKLELIDLTNGIVSNIDAITEIVSIKYLYLYGCHLEKLPSNIGDLKNLQELGLVGNNFTKAEQERIKKALPKCRITF